MFSRVFSRVSIAGQYDYTDSLDSVIVCKNFHIGDFLDKTWQDYLEYSDLYNHVETWST